MMNKHDISNINLGLKQISLLFENDLTKYQDFAGSCIQEYAEQNGEVCLHAVVDYIKSRSNLLDGDILQVVFWLAQDLKIHFRINGIALKPGAVKRALLEFPQTRVEIIANKPVDDVRYHDVRKFYQNLTGDDGCGQLEDQYDFSRLLAKEIKGWEDRLKFCRQATQASAFPGKNAVSQGLSFLKKISERLDPFSLICSFWENREEIRSLSEDAKMLYGFYTHHTESWQYLIQTVDAIEENLFQLRQIPGLCDEIERLQSIILLEKPYDRVEEAKQIAETIIFHNNRIVGEKTEQHRQAALEKAERFVDKMKQFLNAGKADQDLRNRALYGLRAMGKKIQTAPDVTRINRLLEETEDAYDVFVEEVENVIA